MDWITDPQGWIALLTLTALEIVLGIDNIIFISILVGKLPERKQNKARTLGLSLAMLTRIALLFSITLIMRLTTPLFEVFSLGISARDLILMAGGLFLLFKSTHEIHDRLEGAEEEAVEKRARSFTGIIIQILLFDIVFSLDSVITAVGMANDLGVMVTAIIVAVAFMLFAAKSVSDFVHHHPTIKMLALSFLILVGVALVADGLHQHIPRGYIYFSMAFSVGVEMLNIRMRKKEAARRPVKLHERYALPEKGST